MMSFKKCALGLMILAVALFGCSTMSESGAMKTVQTNENNAASGGMRKDATKRVAANLAAATDTSPTMNLARDPQAEEMVRQLSQQARERKAFRFKFVDEFDDIQEDGRRIQFTHLRQGVISRPDRLRIKTTGDISNRTIWKDGKHVTIWDSEENIYGQIADPGTIDVMFDTLTERYHMIVPAADLLCENPGEELLMQMVTSEYVGKSMVDEIPCHHLSFTGDRIDWQIWINAEGKPGLRKLIIDYKNLRGRPQYVLKVLSMEPLESIDETEFLFTAPSGADKVEIQPAGRAAN